MCYYCNARSLKNKLSDLHALLYSNRYSIICFSESWLSLVVSDGILDPRGLYNIYRKDREDGFPGVVIFVSKYIDSVPIPIKQNNCSNAELIGISVKCFDLSIDVYCLYCPPDLSCDFF